MDGDVARAAAMAELHRRFDDALARSRRTKTQLAGLAGLARSTVNDALRPDVLPSAETTAALARALGLDEPTMLNLRRRAGPAPRNARLGRSIEAWHPHDLEVHPAGTPPNPGRSERDGRTLPGYVARAHDRILGEAVRGAAAGHSAMVVLVGSSSTGKTRACWEAVQMLGDPAWRLWHPFDPSRAGAALADLARVGPHTVVWLNEAQHYLGDPRVGEQVAAAVHTLLSDPQRAPVLVLGTLWPEYARRYTRLPRPGEADPHSRARELLAGRTLAVPDTFDVDALRIVTALANAGDRHLADTLSRARHSGRIAQDLAGAPDLLRRYREGTEPEQALLRAAMDARRLGVGPHLPRAFLVGSSADYLDGNVRDFLGDDWADIALDELARPGHGTHAPLRRTGHPRRRPSTPLVASPSPAASSATMYRLADYLEQHGRHERRWVCPPAAFWETALRTATPDELADLARQAGERGRHRHAALLARQAADAGRPNGLAKLARLRLEFGDRDGAECLYGQAADAGDTLALTYLADIRAEAGDRASAERLYRQACDIGFRHALNALLWMRSNDRDIVERLSREAADAGNSLLLRNLADMHAENGDWEAAEHLYRQAADTGNPHVLPDIARMRANVGDRDGAEHLYRQAIDAGNPFAWMELARMREEDGDRDVEHLYRQAAETGHPYVLGDLADMHAAAGEPDDAERLYQQAADAGNIHAVTALARLREKNGDQDVKHLYRQAADAGDTHAVRDLARATHRSTNVWYGWEPDGSDSPPW
ncbi:hypothetical protein ACWGR4_30190 [Embleya sp. NPDC055664]